MILLRGNVAGDRHRHRQLEGLERPLPSNWNDVVLIDKINGEVFFVIPCYQLSANTLIKARNSLFSRGSIYVLLCVKFLPISCLKKLTCKNFFFSLDILHLFHNNLMEVVKITVVMILEYPI